jgi:tetratricopeptide (TPR) repeat protein
MKSKLYLLAGSVVGVLAVSACASSPSSNNQGDMAAAQKSKAYLEGVSVIESSQRSSRGGVCVVPTGGASLAKTERQAAGASVGVGVGTTGGAWRDMLGRANTCVYEKNWAVLESLAGEMAKADLDSPWPAYFLSVASESKGDYSRAMWMAELAQKKSGGSTGLFTYQRGRIWLHMKEPAKAVADLQKAVVLEPRLLEAQLFLGQIYARDLEPEKAIGYYRATLAIDSKNYLALTGLGDLLLAKGSGPEAAELYSRATVTEPHQLRPWLQLGLIHETITKNPELALSAYKNLKSQVDAGSIRGKIEIDLNAKIKTLEESVKAREPAQASTTTATAKTDEKRRVK